MFGGLFCDVRIIQLIVTSSFFQNLPHLLHIQLTFSCFFQNYFQHLLELVAFSNAFIYRWSEQYSILITPVRAEVCVRFPGSVVNPTQKSSTRPFGIADKIVDVGGNSEVYPDLYQYFKLLIFTQINLLNPHIPLQ